MRSSNSSLSGAAAIAATVCCVIAGLICFILPLAWLGGAIAGAAIAGGHYRFDRASAVLLFRTVGFNAIVAAVAVLLAAPAAVAMGLRHRRLTWPLLLALPASLLLPSITFEYGWKQVFRLTQSLPAPQSTADIARCIWTLAAWLWPLPAVVGALALRRIDASVLEQAQLDGALPRTIVRLLIGPMLAGAAIVFVLASQEFAVFEPSGISVVATEVRMVFETGTFSSPQNPITQSFPTGGESATLADLSSRAAAAVRTGAPMLACTGIISAVLVAASRRFSVQGAMSTGPPPRALRGGAALHALAYFVVAVTSALPIASLILSLSRPMKVSRVLSEFSPQMAGSLFLSLTAAAAMSAMAFAAARVRVLTGLFAPATVTFLVGGQMLAIALIHLFNRNATAWIYDSCLVIIIAYIARFGWLLLAAAIASWGGGYADARDMAAVDGASPGQSLRHVIVPLAWPMFAAAGTLAGILCLTEIPATVLIGPQRPQPMVPMLMTWIHMQRYDAMIEGTLLLSAAVFAMTVLAVMLALLARRYGRAAASRRRRVGF